MNSILKSLPLALGLLSSAFASPVTLDPTNPYDYSPSMDPLPNHSLGVLKCADFGAKLTDGAYGDMIPGASLAAADPSNWVEFSGLGEVTFFFSGAPTIRNITVSMANWTPATVYLPDAFTVNGVVVPYSGTFPDMNRAFISLDGEWAGSNLVLHFSRTAGQYFFMDEVSFYSTAGEGVAVPEPASSALLGGVFALTTLLARRPRRARA